MKRREVALRVGVVGGMKYEDESKNFTDEQLDALVEDVRRKKKSPMRPLEVALRVGADWQALMPGPRAGVPGETLVLKLPIRVVSEANAHAHWRSRQTRAKQQRYEVGWAWVAARLPRGTGIPARVRLVRYGHKELDGDNLSGSFKHVRDEVANLLGFDDHEKAVVWTYEQELAKGYGIRIEVTLKGEGR